MASLLMDPALKFGLIFCSQQRSSPQTRRVCARRRRRRQFPPNCTSSRIRRISAPQQLQAICTAGYRRFLSGCLNCSFLECRDTERAVARSIRLWHRDILPATVDSYRPTTFHRPMSLPTELIAAFRESAFPHRRKVECISQADDLHPRLQRAPRTRNCSRPRMWWARRVKVIADDIVEQRAELGFERGDVAAEWSPRFNRLVRSYTMRMPLLGVLARPFSSTDVGAHDTTLPRAFGLGLAAATK